MSARCLWLAVALCGLAAAASGQEIGEVISAGPVVKVRTGGGGERSLRARDGVDLGQVIRTSRGSTALLRFDGDGLLVLGESTRVALEAPAAGEGGLAARVTLAERGTLFLAHDDGAPDLEPKRIEVVTTTARVRLAGTQVLLEVVPGGETAVLVFEGRVTVESLATGQSRVVERQQRLTVPVRGELPRPSAAGRLSLSLALDLLGVPSASFELRDFTRYFSP